MYDKPICFSQSSEEFLGSLSCACRVSSAVDRHCTDLSSVSAAVFTSEFGRPALAFLAWYSKSVWYNTCTICDAKPGRQNHEGVALCVPDDGVLRQPRHTLRDFCNDNFEDLTREDLRDADRHPHSRGGAGAMASAS